MRRILFLVTLGVWPGYFRAPGGWRLTYDPPVHNRGEHEGTVL